MLAQDKPQKGRQKKRSDGPALESKPKNSQTDPLSNDFDADSYLLEFEIDSMRVNIKRLMEGTGVSKMAEMLGKPTDKLSDAAIKETMAAMKNLDLSQPTDAVSCLVALKIIEHFKPEAAVGLKSNIAKLQDRAFPSREEVASAATIEELDALARRTRLAALLAPERYGEEQLATVRAVQTRLHQMDPESIISFSAKRLEESAAFKKQILPEHEASFRKRLGFQDSSAKDQSNRSDPDSVDRSLNKQFAPHINIVADALVDSNGKLTYTTKTGETWAALPFAGSLFDLSVTLKRLPSTSSASPTEQPFISLPTAEMAELLTTKQLDRRLKDVVERYDAEQNPQSRTELRSLNLSPGKTALISVFSKFHDEVISTTLAPAFLLERALLSRYGRGCEPQLIFSDSPAAEIRRSVKTALAENPETQDIVLQIHEHGSPKSLQFKEPLTAKDLVAISNEFPAVRLHVMSIACFGGGLRPELQQEIKENPDLAKRLQLYTQTKPNIEASVETVGKVPHVLKTEISTTAYMLNLIQHLNNPEIKTFGEAVDKADRESKQQSHNDPEALINGDLHSQMLPKGQSNQLRATVLTLVRLPSPVTNSQS
jgi:hypothetical protein